MKIERLPPTADPVQDGPPYSKAVRAGDLIFVTGQVGADATGRVGDGGIGPETRQTIENIRRILASFGLGLEHVVKAMVWLADPSDYREFNAV